MKKIILIFVILLISSVYALEPGKLYINNVFIPFEKAVEETKEASSTFYIYANGQRIAKKQDNKLYYFYNDHLGSPRAISDDKGNIVWKADYLPFGEVFNEQGSNNVKYNSKELDKDTKLHYYGARYYLDDIGRFITADTVEMFPNAYVYVANNPLKFVDPTGNQIHIYGNEKERNAILSFFQTLAGKYQLETEQIDDKTIRIKEIPSNVHILNKQRDKKKTFEMLKESLSADTKFLISFGKGASFYGYSKEDYDPEIVEKEMGLSISSKDILDKDYMPISLNIEQSFNELKETGLRFDLPIILAHELFGHGLDFHYNSKSFSDFIPYRLESQAIFIENIVRSEFGIDKRASYRAPSQKEFEKTLGYYMGDIKTGLITPKRHTHYESLKEYY